MDATPDTNDARDANAGAFPTLARNVVHFIRLLRAAGLPMSPAQAVDALDALHCVVAAQQVWHAMLDAALEDG